MSRGDSVLHTVTRPPRDILDDVDGNSCDFFSYAYLSLAFLLFLCGSGLTFLIIRSDPQSLANNPLNRYWMAGPLFICTGLLVALKVLLYVHRKRLIALIIREMTREPMLGREGSTLNSQSQAVIFDRSSLSSLMSLPPPYDTVTTATVNQTQPSSPPTYDEALALTKSTSTTCDKNLSTL